MLRFLYGPVPAMVYLIKLLRKQGMGAILRSYYLHPAKLRIKWQVRQHLVKCLSTTYTSDFKNRAFFCWRRALLQTTFVAQKPLI